MNIFIVSGLSIGVPFYVSEKEKSQIQLKVHTRCSRVRVNKIQVFYDAKVQASHDQITCGKIIEITVERKFYSDIFVLCFKYYRTFDNVNALISDTYNHIAWTYFSKEMSSYQLIYLLSSCKEDKAFQVPQFNKRQKCYYVVKVQVSLDQMTC